LKDFIFRIPTRILFGVGRSKELGKLCAEAGHKRVFVITGPNIGKTAMLRDLRDNIVAAGLECIVCDKAATDPTIELVDEVTAEAKAGGADAVVALGGGTAAAVFRTPYPPWVRILFCLVLVFQGDKW
jgi:alcohol dehydrogenase class IV